MGIYLNPPATDPFAKARLIKEKAPLVTRSQFINHNPGEDNRWGVVLVDNGAFIAAGVAYSKDEAKVFATDDGRSVEFVIMTFDNIMELDARAAEELKRHM